MAPVTTSNLMSLPVDIPWKRLGTSEDMIDTRFGDHDYPPKWRSSVSLFYYEAPADEQCFEDRTITFVKISCTVTGLPGLGGSEVSIRPEELSEHDLAQAGWHDYKTLCEQYYPCYGALLQVSVFPGPAEQQFPLESYPIILDFEPKKREMYESATEAKQYASQSRSGVNVKKGTTTTESQESGWNIAAMLGWAAGASGGLEGRLSGGYNAKSGTSTETVDMTTADYSREKRENYSYTTNLTHMYHLLDSYYLGTNRAVFMTTPRPHMIDSEYTFVNGPRRLEGVQEFFLVVDRPKDVPGLCVEATLETAHLPVTTVWWPHIIPESDLYKDGNLDKTPEALGLNNTQKGDLGLWLEKIVYGKWGPLPNFPIISWAQGTAFGTPLFRDDKICLLRGWNDLFVDERAKLLEGMKKGSFLDAFGKLPDYPAGYTGRWYYMDETYDPNVNKFTMETVEELATLATAVLGRNMDVGESNARVIYEKLLQFSGWLCITGRTIANCYGTPIYKVSKHNVKRRAAEFLAFEGAIEVSPSLSDRSATNATCIAAANHLTDTIRTQMAASVSAPTRLPYGQVRIGEARFVQDALVTALTAMSDDHAYNTPLEDIRELDPQVRQRLTEVFAVSTRKQALGIKVEDLRSALNLSEIETRRLIGQIIGTGPWPQAGTSDTRVPDLQGMLLDAARRTIVEANLTPGEEVAYQDGLQVRDTVLNQYPNAGTLVKRGSVVQLVVSSGPAVVPNVVGMSAADAIATLTRSSLGVQRLFVVSTEQAEGHVVETTPSAKVKVPRNSKVVLMIARAASHAARHR